MSAPIAWTFEPLGGPNTAPITLTGYNAPFGRPRKGAVVTTGYGLRASETYYNGSGPPTRHIFGDIHDHWELRGRWMDSVLGPSGARQMAAAFRVLIKSAVPCRMTWGSTTGGTFVVFTGLLLHLKVEMENDAQLAWSLTIAIDSDDSTAPGVAPVDAASASDTAVIFFAQTGYQGMPIFPAPEAIGEIALMIAMGLPGPKDILFPPGFIDTTTAVLTTCALVTQGFANIANAITGSVTTAPSADLHRLQSSANQVSAAWTNLSVALDDGRMDSAVADASCNSQTIWAATREADQAAIADMLALLATFALQVETALRQEVKETASAQDGDTWESLSQRHYGSIGKADLLRQANLVRYGSKPRPGQPLSIPRA